MVVRVVLIVNDGVVVVEVCVVVSYEAHQRRRDLKAKK